MCVCLCVCVCVCVCVFVCVFVFEKVQSSEWWFICESKWVTAVVTCEREQAWASCVMTRTCLFLYLQSKGVYNTIKSIEMSDLSVGSTAAAAKVCRHCCHHSYKIACIIKRRNFLHNFLLLHFATYLFFFFFERNAIYLLNSSKIIICHTLSVFFFFFFFCW